MTLLFIDSFDHYDTDDLPKKYNSVTGGTAISAGNGRYGTDGLYILGGGGEQSIQKNLPGSYTTLIIGFAFKYVGASNGRLIRFLDGGTSQVSVRQNNDKTFSVLRDGTTLATSTESFFMDQWYHLEFKALISNTVGTIDLLIDGISWISETGLDTQQSGSNTVNIIRVLTENNYQNLLIDDLYVLNTSGTVNNDFIGDYRVEALFPNGAGNAAEWDRYPDGGEANYENVDENPSDEDTTYNHQDAAGLPQQDTHVMDDLTTSAGVVAGIQTMLDTRKDDAGVVTINPVLRQSGTDYDKTSINLNDSYNLKLEVVEEDPSGGSWTIAGVNSVELGYRRSA
ncbi:hypothetical protein LCGC14_0609660 [marine sediment metagenome]|uniref:Uncharacterized protein n=1 Tax=marine sediment metagenome TaxID=412755 RepID=A0A0F9RCS6_9ZZZZ